MGSDEWSPAGRLTYKQLVRHVVGLNAAPGQVIKLRPEDMIDHGDFVADQVIRVPGALFGCVPPTYPVADLHGHYSCRGLHYNPYPVTDNP